LILELTEHTFSNHRERVYSAVEQLQKHGFGTAMDDFGTGCTAISLLAELPVDWIKLDRSMLLASQKSKRGLDFLCRMIELLKSMEYTVVCEGVETAQEAELLRHIGCDLAQGYFFDSPMPVSDFEVCFDAQFTKTQ
ncbi:MAG: EAL domain-containing protein, partial [Pygmaiobacter massiliensis]